ncbi:MotA/TolQ/ExbB proton channel family protein [Litoribrevibacter albus]|uniref:Biopolymer transport protein exbB1 n=1 Tax=Litoribrevibacter albus TaxID=1473156 RepID=A0AA37S8M7_9GAMM|nr:MotA/TolQ/ExbB proton channel family protein [Litoribrevibacter albus]GLQ30335.1 biopolymer transport protein exbB1 [Litoribrevibacter albus]
MSLEIIQQQLGPLAIPMLVLSLLVFVILIERFCVLVHASLRRLSLPLSMISKDARSAESSKRITKRIARMPLITAEGVQLLVEHTEQTKPIREEVSGIWLLQKKRKLSSGLRFLQVIAVLAPLLGLFGTVLGLIKVFDDLSVVTGAIEPSMLAEGLGLAMYTTAAGLLIAVPAVAGAHCYAMWVDRLIHHAEHVMNHFNLMLEGVSVSDCSGPNTALADLAKPPECKRQSSALLDEVPA